MSPVVYWRNWKKGKGRKKKRNSTQKKYHKHLCSRRGSNENMYISECVVLGSVFFFSFSLSQYSIHWHFSSVNIVQKWKTINVAILLMGLLKGAPHRMRPFQRDQSERKSKTKNESLFACNSRVPFPINWDQMRQKGTWR